MVFTLHAKFATEKQRVTGPPLAWEERQRLAGSKGKGKSKGKSTGKGADQDSTDQDSTVVVNDGSDDGLEGM